MQEQIIRHKHNETIFITVLRQFALPASVSLDTIRGAVRRDHDIFRLCLYGQTTDTWRWDYGTEQEAREHLVTGMVDWLKQYGVYIYN